MNFLFALGHLNFSKATSSCLSLARWNHQIIKLNDIPVNFSFLAKLFPQLCSCNWNGNCDLFSNYE